MPRGGKQGARRGNHTPRGGGRGGRSRGGGNNFGASFVPFNGSGSSTPRRGPGNALTLQEEARNTERHHDFWNADQKLRHSKVNFVSAGSLDPLERPQPRDTESAMASMSLDSLEEEKQEEAFIEQGNMGGPSNVDATPPEVTSAEDDPIQFIVDTYGSGPVQTGLPPPQIRPSSPTPSNSSEEVILFRGRDQQGKPMPRATSNIRVPKPEPLESVDLKLRVVEDRIHEQQALLEEVLHKPKGSFVPIQTPEPSSSEQEIRYSGLPTLPVQTTSAEVSSSEQEIIRFSSSSKSNRSRPQNRKGRRNAKKAEEDALVADYLANIDEEDAKVLKSFGQRELGGGDDWQETGESSSDANRIDQILNTRWGRSEIVDFDDLSTSEGGLGEVQEILSRRDRKSGLQYLVVRQEQSVDEARWVPATSLTADTAMALITRFEAEEKLVTQFISNEEEDTTDSDEDAEAYGVEVEEEEEEDERMPNPQDFMTDAQIARLLAKQEELGMGSDKIVLFDDAGDADEEEDVPFPRTKFSPLMLSSKGKGKSKASSSSSKRPRGEYPSATLMADPFDGFDVMDFERPSLQKKPKGRKGKISFDLSDSELEAAMEMSWKNDRSKKKERKQEREELRAQGLLGNKNGKPDMKQKYKEGMGIHAVKEEIKAFLMSDNTTLALPPMDKKDRKVVHELANAFNLKSKSAGNGDKRFPILYRTQRTRMFNAQTFEIIESKISRRFLPRGDVGKRSGAGRERGTGGGGGFNSAAVSYRDGDVVGGSAPELGAENKGRAMLEKMGWSSGTALGALNNKGILQPVSHVVKTTKAGLG